MARNTLDDLELAGQRVLVRVDVNVPVQEGVVTDDTRIRAILPTLRDILDKGGRPILLAHFGRPKGKPSPELSLRPIASAIEAALGSPVSFCDACVGPKAEKAGEDLGEGETLLLENTRFHPEEEKNDPDFAAALARVGDVYVNDAFSAAHRAHASTEGVARRLPCAAGRLMEKELEALEAALSRPERPVTAVVGGAKVSTKLDLLSNLMERVDALVIGGGMANTFLAAKGFDVGRSLCEHDLLDTARDILAKAEKRGCYFLLPEDVVVAREFKAGAEAEVVAAGDCPADGMILDAGPRAVETICARFEESRTLVWNGPLGAFEIEPFDRATNSAALRAAELTDEGRLLSVAGGGDTVAALNASGAATRFSYVSTAGGAFLEWLEGKTLPGVVVLEGR